MWECAKCREKLEDGFDVCWNCGTSKEGLEDPDFRKADEVTSEEMGAALAVHNDLPGEPIAASSEEKHPLHCQRCERELDFVGTKAFHEGTRWGALGDLGELFVNRERFDVYVCPRCGRVEFFVDGIGEEFRPR
jgi:hypothetical protein